MRLNTRVSLYSVESCDLGSLVKKSGSSPKNGGEP